MLLLCVSYYLYLIGQTKIWSANKPNTNPPKTQKKENNIKRIKIKLAPGKALFLT